MLSAVNFLSLFRFFSLAWFIVILLSVYSLHISHNNVFVDVAAWWVYCSGLIFGFTRLMYVNWPNFTDCLTFGAIISATDPGLLPVI